MNVLATSIFAIFLLLMFAVAIFDIATMTIPNWLNILTSGIFVLLAASLLPLELLGWHIVAGVTVLFLCFGMFALNVIGGGDAKAAAAIALWLGPSLLLEWAIWSVIFGGLLTLIVLSFRRFRIGARLNNISWIARLHRRESGVPYGVALATAALLAVPGSPLFNG